MQAEGEETVVGGRLANERRARSRPARSRLREACPSIFAAALLALAGAVLAPWAIGQASEAQSAGDQVELGVLDLSTRALAATHNAVTARRVDETLERVVAAQIADLRRAAAAAGDAEIRSLAGRLVEPGEEGARANAEILAAMARRAGTLASERSGARERAAHSRTLVVGWTLAAIALVGFATAGVGLASLIKTHRYAEKRLLTWHPADTIETRIDKTNGQLQHLREMTNRQFAGQVDAARELTALERALVNLEAAEADLRAQVRANEGRIRDLEVAQLVDPLTGVLGYNALKDFALNSLTDLLEHDKPSCLIAFDLDDFKWINERYGHGAGDLCIVAFAHKLATAAGDRSTAFRKSGDEFYLLMPGARCAEAHLFADQVLEAINGTEVLCVTQNGQECSIEIQASAGVLDYREIDRVHLERLGPDDRFIQTVGWADAGLSKAKHRGKGRAELYRTGMTQAINPDEYPPQLDAVVRATPNYYPNLPRHVKEEFNRLVEVLLAMVLPRRA